jgi:hypothetical protein
MAYQTRVLPPEEWPRLAGTEAEAVWPHLNNSESQVIVVERNQEIVGTWIVLRLVHVECCWIAPSLRGKGSVAGRLLAGMTAAARRWGATAVWTAAVSEDVKALIQRLDGRALPGEHFVIPVVSEESSCPQ